MDYGLPIVGAISHRCSGIRPGQVDSTTRRAAVLAIAFSVVAVSGCFGGDDDIEGGEILNLDESVVEGRCYDFDPTQDAKIEELPPELPCKDPHSHEIYAVVESTAAVYPGLEALEAEAQVACLDEFEDYVGISPFDSELFSSWIVPTLQSWSAEGDGNKGDRQILCVVGLFGGGQLEGSMAGSQR